MLVAHHVRLFMTFVRGGLQARMGSHFLSRNLQWPKKLWVSFIAGRFFAVRATREALAWHNLILLRCGQSLPTPTKPMAAPSVRPSIPKQASCSPQAPQWTTRWRQVVVQCLPRDLAGPLSSSLCLIPVGVLRSCTTSRHREASFVEMFVPGIC